MSRSTTWRMRRVNHLILLSSINDGEPQKFDGGREIRLLEIMDYISETKNNSLENRILKQVGHHGYL